MARTRQTGSRVPPRDTSQSQPSTGDSEASGRYSWIESTVRDANSFVVEDDAIAYIASLPSTCFKLIHPTVDERVSDHPRSDSMPEMNIMAKMRRAKLERIRANQATPRPSHLIPSPAPRVELVGSDQSVVVAPKPKEKVVKVFTKGGSSKGGSSKDPKIVSDPKVNTDVEVILDPKGVSDPKTTLDPEENLQETIPDAEPFVDQDNKGKKRKELESSSDPKDLKSSKQQRTDKEEDLKKVEEGLKKAEEDCLAALQKAVALGEKNKMLEEESTKLEDYLKVVRQDLQNEKFFKGLADKEKKALQTKCEGLQSQVKIAEDDCLEAKAEIDKAQADLQASQVNIQVVQTKLNEALKELEETKVKLGESESKLKEIESKLGETTTELVNSRSDYTPLYEKYNNTLLNLGAEAYENTIQQLKILNPNLVVLGSDPCAYVINEVIMEDSVHGPIPFVPRMEVVGDSEQVLGLDKKVDAVSAPSGSRMLAQEHPKVVSKDIDVTIHLC
ncbi:FkbM family methyltransferase [Sesbania bispinosa]|nr:FkbM family methyltransferase [Sesbania bispinosa]